MPTLSNRPLTLSRGVIAKFRSLSTDHTEPIRYAIIELNSRRIGYIYVDSVTYDGAGAGGTKRLVNPGKIFEELTDKIVADLVSKQATKVILDIRSSAGGAPYNGARIAARFISKRKKYMISKTTVQFGKEQSKGEYIEPAGNRALAGKKLAILANSNTCSAGEMLVLMLQQADGFIGQWGVPTNGCTGTVIDRELPNGWIFRFTSSRTYAVNGTDYFKVGLQPINEHFQPTNQYHKRDNALIAAIEYLIAYPKK